MRKLASIQQIAGLHPIEGKDRIELAQVLGWYVIVKKGEFKEGDLGVFFEIDSFLPKIPEFEFLKKSTMFLDKEGYRIKTMKMAGVISQGLMLPLSHFSISLPTTKDTDVSDRLNVIKYDTELLSNKNNAIFEKTSTNNFPSFLRKSDQTRIQSLPMFFTQYKDELFEETLKLDGSSCTMYKTMVVDTSLWGRIKSFFGINTEYEEFGVCSRNINLKRSNSQFWEAAIKYNVEAELPIGYAVQGELIAPNIQSNNENTTCVEYYVYDVFNIKTQEYLTPIERDIFINTYMKSIKHVPVIGVSQPLTKTLDELLKSVEGPSMYPNTISEGRVYKSMKYPNVSFKVISNEYLLKEK